MSKGSQNGRPGQPHLNEEWIRKYQSKSLALQELQTGGRHLEGCGACRRVLLARMGPLQLPEELAEIPEALHLSYEQITGYIDGQLSAADNKHVEAHTFICGQCSREIDDLRKLGAQLAAPVVEVKAQVRKVSLWERMAQAFRLPGVAPRLGLAFGAVVAGVLLLIPGSRTGSAGGGFTNLIRDFGPAAHERMHLGGYALLTAGVVYIVYRLLRRR